MSTISRPLPKRASLKCDIIVQAAIGRTEVLFFNKLENYQQAVHGKWQKSGHSLGCAFGIAHGCATTGAIGFEGREDCCVACSVANLAAHLCAEAKGGQILINQKTLSKVKEIVETDSMDQSSLKRFSKPLAVCNVVAVRDNESTRICNQDIPQKDTI